MSGVEWLQIAVQAVVLGIAVFVIRNALQRVEKKLESLEKIQTDCRLDLKDCVTWDELTRELGPLRSGKENHEKRLGVLETKCETRHGEKQGR